MRRFELGNLFIWLMLFSGFLAIDVMTSQIVNLDGIEREPELTATGSIPTDNYSRFARPTSFLSDMYYSVRAGVHAESASRCVCIQV